MKPVPAKKTIIKPTAKPTPAEMVKVSISIVQQVQESLLSPSAVVAALMCSLDMYAKNIEEGGFDPAVIEQCKLLGLDLSATIRKSGLVKTKNVPVPSDKIVTPIDSPLVSSDGSPLSAG